ncbi:hypothetical protein [Phyllobacterium myrsinacearum]|uniref:Uncharacterized protein n=1 Tax=Phyllobacterium myrsinacearum TaxID=28101 RepID=A0A839E944_9HYPH|nr:hypothetical protein [Phyllobacterium myrsinacearum]
MHKILAIFSSIMLSLMSHRMVASASTLFDELLAFKTKGTGTERATSTTIISTNNHEILMGMIDGTWIDLAISDLTNEASFDKADLGTLSVMCNLYRMTTGFQAMRDLFKGIGNRTNRNEFDEDTYPDYPAPIARKDADGEMELAVLRWACRHRQSI